MIPREWIEGSLNYKRHFRHAHLLQKFDGRFAVILRPHRGRKYNLKNFQFIKTVQTRLNFINFLENEFQKIAVTY